MVGVGSLLPATRVTTVERGASGVRCMERVEILGRERSRETFAGARLASIEFRPMATPQAYVCR